MPILGKEGSGEEVREGIREEEEEEKEEEGGDVVGGVRMVDLEVVPDEPLEC